MSHFTVAVITAVPPCDEVLSSALQPFHEFECTGIKDQYVVPVDETDEYLHDYENGIAEIIYKDDQFFAFKYSNKAKEEAFEPAESNVPFLERKLKSGYEIRAVPVKEHFSSFKDYLTEYVGLSLDGKYNELTDDNKVIRYTNPNKCWDWWVVGGRWSNMLITKKGEHTNSCLIGDLDLDGKVKALQKEANELYDRFEQLLGDAPKQWRSWQEIYNDTTIEGMDTKREAYHSQESIQTLSANDKGHLFHPFGISKDDFLVDRETYVKQYSASPFRCYNMLIAAEAHTENKGWYGGSMGWFGCGTQEDNWDQQFQDLLRSQPKDHYITIVDCHI